MENNGSQLDKGFGGKSKLLQKVAHAQWYKYSTLKQFSSIFYPWLLVGFLQWEAKGKPKVEQQKTMEAT